MSIVAHLSHALQCLMAFKPQHQQRFFMQMLISQMEYVTYTRCLKDIKTIEKCYRLEQLFKIGFFNGRFVKVTQNAEPLKCCKTIFDKLSSDELIELKNKIKFVNEIHIRIKRGELKERKCDDCAPLAAESYNTHIKVISAWNAIFTQDELHIQLPTDKGIEMSLAFTEKTMAQMADERALTSYFDLLAKYPKLKRQDSINDYSKGVYQIIYDETAISNVRQEIYQRLYTKAKSQGLTDGQSDDLAITFSRPGIVCEDQFWLWIRDVVISPQNYKHTYNRIVWKSDLERVGGAAALPILVDKQNNKKFVIQLAFRHATNSWEFEMPRGGSKPNETPIATAKREILEETGCETDDLIALGAITPDSGLTASVVPIFCGKVSVEKEVDHDKTEAIKGKHAFTLVELMEGLKRGYIEVEINNNMTQVPIRDPFLSYAILMAQYNMQL